MFYTALLIAFAVIVLLNSICYIYLGQFTFKSFTAFRKREHYPTSIIICAKNEAENLKRFLPFICNQAYPVFEVIVVNDGSTDNTQNVLLDVKQAFPELRIIKNTNCLGKKASISKAIELATYNHLLFTDADCKPESKYWIQHMTQNFSENHTIVLGYSGYKKEKGILNSIIRYETVLTALQYFGMAHHNNAYMGVGRNLAYTKACFKANKGFNSHKHIASGDDDLFIAEASTKTNTAISLNKASFTTSLPKASLKAWFHQKRRHITTAKRYSFKIKTILAGFYISQLLFWLFCISILIIQPYSIVVISLFLIREFIQGFILYKTFKTLHESALLLIFPLLEILLLSVQACLFITNIVSKPKSWD